MKNFFFGSVVLLSLVFSSAAQAVDPDSIVGYWRTIDDETGFAKAVVQIQKSKDGKYIGAIVETIPRPDYTPVSICQKCPAPFTNKNVMDIPLVWNLKVDPNKESSYTNGYVIDPLSGKIYAVDLQISPNGRRILLRGKVIGAGFLNRTQTWLREINYKPKQSESKQ